MIKKFEADSENDDCPHARAAALWPIIAARVNYKIVDERALAKGAQIPPGLTTYTTAGLDLGYDENGKRKLGGALGSINWYCLENEIPVLNSTVVQQKTGKAGQGKPDGDADEIEQALAFDWMLYRAPSASALRKASRRYHESRE